MLNMKDVDTDVSCNMSEICRLCLSKDGGILPIFGEEESGNQSVPLSFRILACVSIEVSISDGLPKLICQNCLSQVNTWHMFKQVCDSAQASLKEWLNKLQEQAEPEKTIEVKQEPPDEEDDDMIEIHDDVDSTENSVLLDIKQESIEIEVCDDDTPEEEPNNIEVLDDPLGFTTADDVRPLGFTAADAVRPLGFTAADAVRILPVRSIKSEPIDADLIEEPCSEEALKDSEKVLGPFIDNVISYEESNNAPNSIENDAQNEFRKPVKVEPGIPKKKAKRRRPLTLRKKRPPSVPSEIVIEDEEPAPASDGKQQYFCFPAADGKQHYFCIPCGKSFPFRSYYLRHEKTHRKTHHICSFCDKLFSCKTNLDRHVRLHTGQKPYTCQDCSEGFQNRSQYIKHKSMCAFTAKPEPPKPEPSNVPATTSSNRGGDSYPCYICRQTFDSIHRLQLHRRSHEEFSCRRCGKSFSGGIALSNHLRTHNFDGFKRYSCKICKKAFSNVTSLVSHKRFHTLRENAAATKLNSKPRSRPTVSKTILKPAPKQVLKPASKQVLKPASKQVLKPASKPIPKPAIRHLVTKPGLKHFGNSSGRGYSCAVCRKWVKTRSVLRRHMTSHTKLKLFSCVICNISMGYASSLHKHMRITHNVEISYKDIHAMFNLPALEEQEALCYTDPVKPSEKVKKSESEKEKAVTVAHSYEDDDGDYENYSEPGKYTSTCNICFKNFSNKRLLENHMKIIHMGGKAYKCRFCSKLFAYKHLLDRHAKLHAGGPGFTCSVCGKSFSDAKTLRNHKGVHTRFKYYSCHICSKSFNGLKNWEQHQRLHSSSIRFMCKLCGKTFFTKTDLIEHKKMHIKLKIYTCGVCKNSYNSMSTLNRHKRKKHGSRAIGMNPSDDSEDELLEEDQCFICTVCDKTFNDALSLSKHKLIHVKRDFFKAEEITSDLTPEKGSNTMPTISQERFCCVLCNRDFSDQSSLSKHKGWHSRRPLDKLPVPLQLKGKRRLYVCGFCKRSFTTSGSLSKHRRYNCPPKRNYTKNVLPPALAALQLTPVTKPPIHSMKSTFPTVKASTFPTVKASTFPTVKAMSHVKKVLPQTGGQKLERQRHFPCPMCERVFNNKKALIRHKGWHTRSLSKNHQTLNESPQENIDVNVTEEPVASKRRTCDVCFKTYSSSSTLSRHKRLHKRKILPSIKSVEKPVPVISDSEGIVNSEGLHLCRYCRKPFRFRRHMIDHERVHTGERPFSCNLCPLSFSRRAILWRHKKTHLGIRPFSCNLCPKTFLMNFQLTRHLAEKHTVKYIERDFFPCQKCDKTYRTVLALSKHEYTQHQV